MKEMENVYSSESRDAAPKVVIFRTASTSVLLVGTLTSISELLSFGYFKVVGVEQVLCFVWQGVLAAIAGILGLTYVHRPRINKRWCMAKFIVVLSIVTAIFTLTSIIFRILQVEKFRRRKQESENDDKRKLVFLHFSFSIILEIALFTLSVLLANITITIYKLRGIIDGTTQSPRNESPELNPMDPRYLNLNEEDV